MSEMNERVATQGGTQVVKVWDPLVRIGHWALVLCVAAAWITSEGGHVWHERLGYATLAIVAARVLWGFVGPRYARFAQFLRSPAATLAYAGRTLAWAEPRHIGHNPLGGWMIVALIVCVILTGASGWLFTSDAFWGVEWVEEVHEFFANSLLALAGVHIAGVVFASFRHRENLAEAMLSGTKRAPGPGDVS